MTTSFADYDVVGLVISRENDFTVIEALTTGPTNIKTAKLAKPDRLVIDFEGGIHKLKSTGLPALPPGIVIEVRTAQYQSKPIPITRIVLVLAEPAGEIKADNGPRSGKVRIHTAKYPQFAPWSIGMETKIPAPKEEISKPPVPPVYKDSIATKIPEMPLLGDTTTKEIVIARTDSLTDATGFKASFMRPLVKYGGKKYRDPFVEARPTEEIKLGEEMIPSVENLRLVGLVTGYSGEWLAVLQDNRGWGYIMGIGDTVRDGKVSSITDSSATFNIVEFGIARPVTLGLLKEAKTR